jgi:hypothetical protein
MTCENCHNSDIATLQNGREVCLKCANASTKERVLESGKLIFSIVGACGFAGCLAGMHWLLGTIAVSLIGGAWYSLYRIVEV